MGIRAKWPYFRVDRQTEAAFDQGFATAKNLKPARHPVARGFFTFPVSGFIPRLGLRVQTGRHLRFPARGRGRALLRDAP